MHAESPRVTKRVDVTARDRTSVAALAGAWALGALALNLAWELAQLPLYTLDHDADRGYVLRSLLHCTAGDVLIALGSYLVAALGVRDARWPLTKPLGGICLATAAGLAYTAASEAVNVYVLGSWAYREAMPRLLGIGVSPLAQWLLLPGVALLLVRRGFARTDARIPNGHASPRATRR